MDRKTSHQTVSAIVPAYNEADRIAAVLAVLTTHPMIDEVIVVDDGSTDATIAIAQQFPVHLITHPINLGKGRAMDDGVQAARHDVILFVDADVIGLSHAIVEAIIAPVISGKVDMFIGMRNRKIYVLHLFLAFLPLLGGERALTRSLWQHVPNSYKERFRIEAALNFYATYYGNDFDYRIFSGLRQVIKEKKYGFVSGMSQRIRMFFNIFSAQLKLQFVDIPKSEKNHRLVALLALQNIFGVLIGVILLIGSYVGPYRFALSLFAQELQEDRHSIFVNAILKFTQVTTAGTVAVVGALILLMHVAMLVFTFRHFVSLFDRITKKMHQL